MSLREREGIVGSFRMILGGLCLIPSFERLFGSAGDGSLVQYSVYITGSRRGAMVAVKLARHYGGDVMVFKGGTG